MNKNRHIIRELQEFFANNDSSKAINSISTIMNSIRIQSKVIGSVNMSQFLLDFSLHGEEGKRSDKPQGLSKKQAEARYRKEYTQLCQTL